eukprot:m.852617 g.852617  ORF g.852617 m.852617 type:complete len:103 (-) comp59602_c0_seq5:67-375(-)
MVHSLLFPSIDWSHSPRLRDISRLFVRTVSPPSLSLNVIRFELPSFYPFLPPLILGRSVSLFSLCCRVCSVHDRCVSFRLFVCRLLVCGSVVVVWYDAVRCG